MELVVPLSLVAIVGGIRLAAAWLDQGVYWPDEVYQYLEQAHRMVFGYGFVPWEFFEGRRSWVLPGAIAAMWKTATLLGVNDSRWLVFLARAAAALVSTASVGVAAMKAGQRGKPGAAAFTAVAAGFFPILLLVGYRTFSETFAGALLVLIWALLERGASSREDVGITRALVAGLLAGLVFAFRIQILPALAVLGLSLVVRKRRHDFQWFGFGAVVSVWLFAGLLDAVMLGEPFASTIDYLGFHVVTGGAAFGKHHPAFYLITLWTSGGVFTLALLAGFVAGVRRAPVAAIAFLSILASHAIIPHKELRFLVIALPLGCVTAGVGLAEILARVRNAPRGAPELLAGVLGAGLLFRAATNPFAAYGAFMHPGASPWGFEASINRLLHDAGRRPDLCGLGDLAGENIVYDGGYTWLHEDVPIVSMQHHPWRLAVDPVAAATVNYAIVPDALVPKYPGWTRVEADGAYALIRRDGGCEHHPELAPRVLDRPLSEGG